MDPIYIVVFPDGEIQQSNEITRETLNEVGKSIKSIMCVYVVDGELRVNNYQSNEWWGVKRHKDWNHDK